MWDCPAQTCMRTRGIARGGTCSFGEERLQESFTVSANKLAQRPNIITTRRQHEKFCYVGSQHRLAKLRVRKAFSSGNPTMLTHCTSSFWIMRMTEPYNVQGYSSSIPGIASARNSRLGEQIIRGGFGRNQCRRRPESMRCDKCACRCAK